MNTNLWPPGNRLTAPESAASVTGGEGGGGEGGGGDGSGGGGVGGGGKCEGLEKGKGVLKM